MSLVKTSVMMLGEFDFADIFLGLEAAEQHPKGTDEYSTEIHIHEVCRGRVKDFGPVGVCGPLGGRGHFVSCTRRKIQPKGPKIRKYLERNCSLANFPPPPPQGAPPRTPTDPPLVNFGVFRW